MRLLNIEKSESHDLYVKGVFIVRSDSSKSTKIACMKLITISTRKTMSVMRFPSCR